jgi:lysophospholipid acyltransferase (LPLAT)-like uncharacterized protein
VRSWAAWWRRAWIRVVGVLGAWLVRGLGATWRLRMSGEDPFASGAPFVGVLWHRGLLVAAYAWRDRGIAAPVSRSDDGELMSAALGGLGFAESPRGSSSRGGAAALREMVRRIRAGQVVALLPDGPRGPAGVAKPGAVALACLAGVPIVPVGLAARPCRRLRSWDRALLPAPFARVYCHYGPPLHVPKSLSSGEITARSRELESTLHGLDREVERRLGGGGVPALAAPPKPRDE